MRIEKDTLGEVEVPGSAYYGAQTQRAVNNFRASGKTFPDDLVEAYLLLKKACAAANAECGKLEENKKNVIVEACEAAEKMNNQFVVDVFQAGAGTSFNMNVNEVVANLSAEILGEEKGDYSLIHPNDHVNMSQSTNDTFPTASHIAVIWKADLLLKVLYDLSGAFKAKGKEFSGVHKPGRTHLMDATPVTAGAVFGAYASILELLINYLPDFQKLCVDGITVNEERCRNLLLSNPALATLLSTEIGYERAAKLAEESLETGVPVPALAVEKGLVTKEKAAELFKNIYRDEPCL